MKAQKFTLTFKPTQQNFSTKFVGISKDFLRYLKDAELLPHVLPDLFPETFNGEIVIDYYDQGNEEAYSVDFYLDLGPTDEMKETMTKYNNRDIGICEESNKLEFSLKIDRRSGYLKKENKKKIILSF